MTDSSVSLELHGRGVTFSVIEPAGMKLDRTGIQLNHLNGVVEAAFAEFSENRVTYQLQANYKQ
jgi:hypothetical protein